MARSRRGGQITGLKISDHSMPADALIGVGRYATVVVDIAGSPTS